MSRSQGNRSKLNLLILLLLLITAAAVCVSVWAVFLREEKAVLAPDYAPQQVEENAEVIPDDDAGKLDKPQGGGSVSLTYAREVSIGLESRSASLLFANPGKSNQDMMLQIIIQGTVIVQSGVLKPGHQVTTLSLLDGMEKKLTEGVYEGKFNVLYYDPETSEKAIVNTEIPVTITVNK